jgi:hypothetical protein
MSVPLYDCVLVYTSDFFQMPVDATISVSDLKLPFWFNYYSVVVSAVNGKINDCRATKFLYFNSLNFINVANYMQSCSTNARYL